MSNNLEAILMPTGIPCPAHKRCWYNYPNDLRKKNFVNLCKVCKKDILETHKLIKSLKLTGRSVYPWIGAYAVKYKGSTR
jgi:hypothetical protein